MHSKELNANYLNMEDGKFTISEISIESLFGQDPTGPDAQYSFESAFVEFQSLVIGRLPNTDLVISSLSSPSTQTRALEIKLTALPDNSTSSLPDDQFGSELVVRPDTIFYLCATLFEENKELIAALYEETRIDVDDWSEPASVLAVHSKIENFLHKLSRETTAQQSPVLLQPIWKTKGKSPVLADNCLDIFTWSSLGFLEFILGLGDSTNGESMTRGMRSVVWIYRVLEELTTHSRVNFAAIVDQLSFNTKNDKAFAANGKITYKYMAHANLTTPRITKDEIKNIIMGGGQNYLSPERRFDAILASSPEIFS